MKKQPPQSDPGDGVSSSAMTRAVVGGDSPAHRDDEGRDSAVACSEAPQAGMGAHGGPPINDAELEQLRVRVIALENLVVALLAESPARQQTLAREMARHISPRAGFTQHPLTLRAANGMRSLVNRAGRYIAD